MLWVHGLFVLCFAKGQRQECCMPYAMINDQQSLSIGLPLQVKEGRVYLYP